VPADEEWVLDHHEADAGMRDEIHDRVSALAAALRRVATERSAE
jgi:hypothetical protein